MTSRLIRGRTCGLLETVVRYDSHDAIVRFVALFNKRLFELSIDIQGALGLGSEGDEYEPETVRSLRGIESIGTGHYHSFGILQNGQLWSWGYRL